MTTSNSPRLDPEQLTPEALDAWSYHRVVGPALQTAAEVAAKRGYPTLHDDMPAMLALVELITQLRHALAEHYPEQYAHNEALLENAATGACVMVFQEAEMPAESIGQCLAALETAYQQVQGHGILQGARPFIAMAWSHLEDDERDAAKQCLQQATQHIVDAIDDWQARVH